MLTLFLSVGIALEAMHGLKVGFYLDVQNEARRLMWTLGHAHGTLLSLVNLAFAAAAPVAWRSERRGLTLASSCLLAATILLPGGFFLGGIRLYDGDPGFGVWLVPFAALLLLTAVFTTARSVTRGS